MHPTCSRMENSLARRPRPRASGTLGGPRTPTCWRRSRSLLPLPDCAADRTGSCLTPSTRPVSQLATREDGVAVLTHRLASVLARLPAEAAVHSDTELVQVLRRRLVPALHAGDAVQKEDDAEVDARVRDVQVCERLEEALVLAAEVAGPGEVHPVNRATRACDHMVRHAHHQAHVARLVHRPLRERAVAEVVANEHVLGNEPGQTPDRPREALPGSIAAAHPGDHALDVLHLVTDVPLDRELARRDLAREPLELSAHEVLERRLGGRVVRGEVDLERVERARRERQADLETHARGDDLLVAQRPERPVRLDRVVYARPAVPTHLRALAHLEDRRLVRVARDPGRR